MAKRFKIYFPQLSSNSQQAITLAKNKKLGEYKQGKVIYSKYEALYLIETKQTQLIKNNKSILINQTIKHLSKNKDFQNNYSVFKDLRKKGYIVKTGLKFGVEFRVYKSKKVKHATWLVYITKKNKINLKDFISKNRIAHSTGKKLLLAIIDSQQDIIYYEVDWIKP